MRIVVDREKCIGAGQCVMSAPEVFEQDETGTVAPVTESPGPGTWDEVREAAGQCPVEAISLRES